MTLHGSLIHGDSLQYLRQMPENSFDLVLADPPYDQFPLINDAIREARRVSSGASLFFMYPENLVSLVETPDQIAFWIKPPSTKNTSKRYSRFAEAIACYDLDRSPFVQETHWTVRTGIFHDTFTYKQTHPHEKPESLIEKLLAVHILPGSWVLDPFAGSGTVAWVCETMGVECLSIELEA